MKTLFTVSFFVFAFALCATTIVAKAQVNKTDSLALVDLYNSTNGPNWTNHSNWLTATVEQWFGVHVNNNRVYAISLSYNNLSGTMPSSLGNLSNLTDLSLISNQLSGSIPPELGKLSNLSYLVLDNNQLTGSIPYELGNLSKLLSLYLSNNQLSGNIPPTLGNLSNLSDLFLDHNQLSGSIPPTLGNLFFLNFLYLNNNNLSGAIPPFGFLPHLFSLNFSYNQFTFEGLEALVQKFPFAIYDHQARITINTNGNTLSVPAGGTLSNNTYIWLKEGQTDYKRITGDSTFHPLESGRYVVRVKNKIANKLALTSKIIQYTAPVTVDAITSHKTGISNEGFIVYPNPVKDVLHVTTNGSASFSLVSKSGKVLFTTNIAKAGTINVSMLAAGEYYLKNNTTNVAKKVVIVR